MTSTDIAVPVVEGLRAEYSSGRALGLGEPAPRLSWRTTTSTPDWAQAGYEVEVDGTPLGRTESRESVFVPWPAEPLRSRRSATVRVRVWGSDGSASVWSDPLDIEAALLEQADWTASWITAADGEEARPQRFRRGFTVPRAIRRARLYATSAGVHVLQLNAKPVGENVLAPGWTAYGHRLHYDTHDVTNLLTEGENVLGADVADGWWRGNLGWEMKRNVYGDRIGLFAQLEITYADGTTENITTDLSWQTSSGPWLDADIYNGETYDARLADVGWSLPGYDDSAWKAAELFEPKVGPLAAPEGPPVQRMEELPVREVLTTPSGRTILDFGQNLVGWVRFTVDGDAGTMVTLRHAEVLEHGELGTRPLRNAKATDVYILSGGGGEVWEPTFTFHGFRYVEVDGWPGPIDPSAFRAVVVHSVMERTGTFSCSNGLLNQLHSNAVWSMRGNFLEVPTDCPQRDERLGWTGDLQVFTPTATFLHDVGGFLADWLADLRLNQSPEGAVPIVVPAEPFGEQPWSFLAAAWSDAATIVPWVLYERYGDRGLLGRQFESMRRWVEFVRAKAGERNLWPEEFQLGDWLDPSAPPDQPWLARTDPVLVASAYYARSAQIVSDAATVLGHDGVAAEFAQLAATVRQAFRDEYVSPNGRVSSDSVTAYALAVVFDLYETPAQRARAADRLAMLAEVAEYRIATGFVGTPIVLPAFSAVGDTRTAYRLLTETKCPSWLYPVTMGATTIWERWDCILPDGSINPGEMTSFNHYALGSVVDWMHRTIGGIAPDEPGCRHLRIAPVPGRTVTSATCTLRTPYGLASCSWRLDGATFTIDVEVPPNSTADVVLPGNNEPLRFVGSGSHHWDYVVSNDVVAFWADQPADPSPKQ